MWGWVASLAGSVWGGISKWVAIAGAFALAVVGALVYGREKGVASAKQADTAAKEHDAAQAAEKRNEIEAEVDRLPAPASGDPVPVADAPPDSAAGKLRTDGWTRD